MTLNGRYALYCRKYAFCRAHHKQLNEDRPILSAAEVYVMTIVSGYIKFIWIFAGVPSKGASNHSGVVDNGNFQWFRSLFLRKLYRWGQHYYLARRSPSSAFQWSQNAWPWMTLNSYFNKTVTVIRHVTIGLVMYGFRQVVDRNNPSIMHGYQVMNPRIFWDHDFDLVGVTWRHCSCDHWTRNYMVGNLLTVTISPRDSSLRCSDLSIKNSLGGE